MSRMQVLSRAMACAVSLMVLAGCATAGRPASPSTFNPETGIVADAPTSQFPALARVAGCQVVYRDGQLLLFGPTEDHSLVQTRAEYRPPFALRLRAKTDTTSIRLYYSAGMVILNWEIRPSELRFHDPLSGTQYGFPGKGEIEPNKFHDIVWEVYPDGTRLMVDGNEVMRKLGEYGDLMAAVGVGPAYGSVITLESFSVRTLKGRLEKDTGLTSAWTRRSSSVGDAHGITCTPYRSAPGRSPGTDTGDARHGRQG